MAMYRVLLTKQDSNISMQNRNRTKFGTTRTRDHFDGARAFTNLGLEFGRAVAARPDELHESFYIFGGRRVHIRILGRTLAEHIVRPFSHLQTEEESFAGVQLTIELWDENRRDAGRHFALPDENGEWYETTFKSPDGRFIGQQLPYTFSCLDRRRSHIVASIAWSEKISNYERAKPLARLLLEWHNDQDIQMIHAALVARDDQGVLVAGKRGAGKSTFALACVHAGLDYVSEDFVGLERCPDDSFVGHGLYNSVFLENVAMARFGDLVGHAIESGFSPEEKSAVILSEVFPERLKRAVPIRVLALPRVVDTVRPKLRPASKGDALLRLGSSSLLQIPNRQLGPRGFDRLSQLVEEVPCYWLEVGADLRSIPASVEMLLAEVGAT